MTKEELGKRGTLTLYNQAYVEELKAQIADFKKENAELKKQIEKMKCCQNCKFDDFMEEPCCNCSRCFGDMREGYSDKWEIN